MFIIHVSLNSPAIPLPDGSRLTLLRDNPSFSIIAVPALSIPSLTKAAEPQMGGKSLFVTSCKSAISMSCRNKKLLSICIFNGDEIPFMFRVAILCV